MKTAKLTLGILTIIFSVVVTFQSCAAGANNALSENGSSSGSAGLFVSILMLAGAIVMIATRNSPGKGGSVAGMILFVLSALLAFPNSDTFPDLKVWGTLCLILAALNFFAAFKKKNNVQNNNNDNIQQ